MRKIFLIAFVIFGFFLIEQTLFEQFGRWFTPDFMILVVIYFNLAFGIRYSLVAAVFAGLFKDSFTINVFGMNIFAFILCAFLTTWIKRYLLQVGSGASRILIVMAVTIFYCLLLFILNSLYGEVDFAQML